ncbi:DNA-binding transcriptional regulator, MarR family [Micromonospora pattaloongensis]|uniref:DNA-binding transcriptional regulator, MarR family n=1 Tax=Micromonospora pattaloongensis TaxID=405436 RepID=A0A1H3LUA1_9ACTN|nr:MarR family winged helix-turn-helix transcriptional regulator [Micromonospora pattaloongensis]SDY67425.1 DNA-binding transcriptional regulator, MarR family [Micromonospora pattaloongensis]
MAGRERLVEEIMSAQRRLQVLFAYDRSDPLFNANVTVPQLKVLLLLFLRGPAAGQDLSRLLGVGLATVTGIVDRLVGNGLVSRREDPRDRRVRRVELTDEGHRLMETIITAGMERQRRLLDRLNEAQLRTVVAALTIMIDAATADADPDA